MIVSNKKTKVRLVVSTILFFLVFIVLVGGSLLIFVHFTGQKYDEMESEYAVSGQAVSGSAADGG